MVIRYINLVVKKPVFQFLNWSKSINIGSASTQKLSRARQMPLRSISYMFYDFHGSCEYNTIRGKTISFNFFWFLMDKSSAFSKRFQSSSSGTLKIFLCRPKAKKKTAMKNWKGFKLLYFPVNLRFHRSKRLNNRKSVTLNYCKTFF